MSMMFKDGDEFEEVKLTEEEIEALRRLAAKKAELEQNDRPMGGFGDEIDY